jgi:hypothetical protein
VTDHDVRALLDMIDAGYQDEPDNGLPSAVAEGLSQLVPCDSISFLSWILGTGGAVVTVASTSQGLRQRSGFSCAGTAEISASETGCC